MDSPSMEVKLTDRQLYKSYPNKFKLIITFACYFCFINYGIFFFLPPSSLIDVTYLLDTSLPVSSNGITWRTVAYSLGSIAAGPLFKVLDRRLGLIILFSVGAMCLMTYPFLVSVPLFMFSMFVQGFVGGSVDVAVNSWVLDLWGENCNTYMQGLHFSYGFGTAVAPFVLAPFLGLEPKQNETSTTVTTGDDSLAIESLRANKETAKSLDTFRLVFIIEGILMMTSVAIQVVLYLLENRKIKQIKCKASKDGNENQAMSVCEDSSCSEKTRRSSNSRTLLMIGAAILFVYVGMEVNSMNFVTEYVHFLDYDVETATNQSTYMNSAFALFRFIGIFASRFLTTDKMALIHLSMIATSSLILLFLSKTSLLWITIGIFLFGAGCSVIFPCVYSMIEERTQLSNFSVGLLMFAGSIASIIYPLVVPLVLETYPMLYVYNNVVSIAIVITLVFVLLRQPF